MSQSDEPQTLSDERPPFLVVTGSSAGGINALTAFVSHLPEQFSVPIVVAQHLAPQHQSHLAEILAQNTTLRVQTIGDDAEVEPGVIYVVPPNHDVEVVDSVATTRLQLNAGPKPSVDRLFESASAVYGDRLIAIILSGLGSDGARGARAVKRAGGTIIVQDPESAGYASMPLSIPATLVDIVAPPEAMGRMVLDLIGSSELGADSTDRTMLRTLLVQLRDRSGIDFLQYKTPTIMRRLSRLMVANGARSIAEYVAYLHRNPDGYQRLVNAFLIKVTEFFRDPALFDTLRDQILPKLMLTAREEGRELRIWSAGTSTGEEAYSLAILCAELQRDQSLSADVRIFATDIDEQAIAFARRGVYTADSVRDLPEGMTARYFTRHDDRLEVSKYIRNMTVFGQHDLGQRAPFPRIDLVLCRNVLIYFTKELQARALHLFAFALRDGGYLVLGKAESTTPLPNLFKPFNPGLKMYQRDGERLLLPPARLKDPLGPVPPIFLANTAREVRSMYSGGESPRAPSPDTLTTYVNASVVGVVVVDRNYDIVAINSAARAMLQVHGLGVGSDLIHLAPTTGANLRAMIDSALLGESVDPAVLLVKDPVTGIDRWLQVHCTAHGPSSPHGATAGIVIVDVTRYERKAAEAEVEGQRVRSDIERQVSRADELSSRIKLLLVANEELTTMNAELRTYNEQLLINAEEAASSNEEVETLNEELQATNEELETLNEELQATVEELNTTNDELEETNRSKQTETADAATLRLALERALEGLAPSSAILNSSGELVYIAPAFRELATNGALGQVWSREPSIVVLSDKTRYATKIASLGDGLTLVTFEHAR